MSSSTDDQIDQALATLTSLGLKGRDVYLAELLPLIEMAWADGKVTANERALLENCCESLTERLNRQAGAPFFHLARSLLVLDRLTQRRMTPAQRKQVLLALRTWLGDGPSARELRESSVGWAEAIAAVDGSPAIDPRERFWLARMRQTLLDGR